jgi:protein arginine N-methyltransferase 2
MKVRCGMNQADVADLKAFFEYLPDLLDGEEATFSFWNGLGATSEFFYWVSR